MLAVPMRINPEDETSDIFLIDTAGSPPVNLTAHSKWGEHYWPVWSPDGTRLAFVSRPSLEDWRHTTIEIVNADGTGLVDLSLTIPRRLDWSSLRLNSAVWSRDGSLLAFTAYEEDADGSFLFVSSADGTDARLVASDIDRWVEPAWSSDGRLLYSVPDSEGARTVHSVSMEDGASSEVAELGPVYDPEFSPDGRLVAWLASSPDGGSVVLGITDPSTQSTFRVDLPFPMPETIANPPLYYILGWSPTGDRLALEARYQIPPSRFSPWMYSYLFVVDARGAQTGAIIQIAYGGLGWSGIAWSPSGRDITYSNGYACELLDRESCSDVYRLQVDHGSPWRLTNVGGADTGAQWSPDGRRLAFASAGTVDLDSLYVMSADGTQLVKLLEGWSIGYPVWSPLQ
jgi:Tol biopolymer transport system component